MWVGLADEEGRTWYSISSEVDIDPSTNDFISGVFRLITPKRFAAWSGLGEEAAGLYAKHGDVDLQIIRSLVQPWPDGWPDRLLDLNAAVVEAGVEVPPRAVNHLHPRIHTEWNRELFKLIRMARERSTQMLTSNMRMRVDTTRYSLRFNLAVL